MMHGSSPIHPPWTDSFFDADAVAGVTTTSMMIASAILANLAPRTAATVSIAAKGVR
jgi:hypothetical protein